MKKYTNLRVGLTQKKSLPVLLAIAVLGLFVASIGSHGTTFSTFSKFVDSWSSSSESITMGPSGSALSQGRQGTTVYLPFRASGELEFTEQPSVSVGNESSLVDDKNSSVATELLDEVQTAIRAANAGSCDTDTPPGDIPCTQGMPFTVTNSLPTVTINTPSNGAIFTEGDDVNFNGSANDLEDGDLAAIIDWVSDLDGDLGTDGASFSVNSLTVGAHLVTATVIDSNGGVDSDTINVTVEAQSCFDLPEPGEYGRISGGDQSHINEIAYCFMGQAGDTAISFEAWDIDFTDEVSIYVNGQYIQDVPLSGGSQVMAAGINGINGSDSVETNNAWTGPYIVTLDDGIVNDAATNIVTFTNNYNPPRTYIWGIRDVQLVTPPTPSDCEFPLPETGEYGRITGGDQSHVAEIEYCFDGQAGDVAVSFDAWDIDFADEVSLYLNGQYIQDIPLSEGQVVAAGLNGINSTDSLDTNNTWTGPYVVTLLDNLVNDGSTNIMTFTNNYNPPKTYIWGIRDVQLTTPPPTSNCEFPLPEAGAYGRIQSGDQTHIDEIEYCFDGQSGDVAIEFEAWDIDWNNEVSIYVNGTYVDDVPVTPGQVVAANLDGIDTVETNNAWTGFYVVTLPDDIVNDAATNIITFTNNFNPPKSYFWGIREVDFAAQAQSLRYWSVGGVPGEVYLFSRDVSKDGAIIPRVYVPILTK